MQFPRWFLAAVAAAALAAATAAVFFATGSVSAQRELAKNGRWVEYRRAGDLYTLDTRNGTVCGMSEDRYFCHNLPAIVAAMSRVQRDSSIASEIRARRESLSREP
jgi:hypothetical protein